MTRARPPVPLPEPALTDGALMLRPWGEADAPALAAAWADADIVRWTGVPAAADEAAARRWISGGPHRRARGLALDLVIEVAGEVAGEVGLAFIHPLAGGVEIGWWIAPSHRGQGLAARAAHLVASWAVEELAIDRVLARCHQGNPASAAVARAAGFVRDGVAGETELWRFA